MRGRSRVSFVNETRNLLQSEEVDEDGEGMETRADWLRKLADEHTVQGNRLTNIVCRIKVSAGSQTTSGEREANTSYNTTTINTYRRKAKSHA